MIFGAYKLYVVSKNSAVPMASVTVCPNCGRPVSDEMDFCVNCGTKVR